MASYDFSDLERITIPMSDRPAVSIDPSEWPEICCSVDRIRISGDVRDKEYRLAARQHTDGRCLVYGAIYRLQEPSGSTSVVERRLLYSGFLVPADAFIKTLRQVAATICHSELAQRCIEALPVEEL